jgi:hypothetical protein
VRGMQFSPPAALQNLRALIFGDHALNLQQHILLEK